MRIMDIERPHRTTTNTTTSELFICFTPSLPHSSSMKLSSKSTLSPAMFSTTTTTTTTSTTKKSRRSSTFAENHEPSSPKVTCIGQVRGKTKKQGKKMKMLAHRNQRWVHLPLTICDTFKCLGSEFSCLLPCKSSCFSSSSSSSNNNNDKNRRENGDGGGSSCGVVFRWMVSLQEGKDVELVVGGEDEETIMDEKLRGRVMERECSRRSIFDDMEFDDLFNDVNNNVGCDSNDNYDDDNDKGGRISICVPPKNALLLMRCRSDPMRMASLSKKFWDPCVVQQDNDGDYEVDEEEKVVIKEINHVKFDEKLKVQIKEEKKEEIIEERVNLEDEIEGIEEINFEKKVVEEEDEKQEIKIREKTEEKQSIETGEDTEEIQNTENSVKELQVLQNMEETQLMNGLNLADGCSIEAITAEKKVEECKNEQDLVKIEEGRQMVVQKVGQREESCVLSTDSSTFVTSSEESTIESKELEPNQAKEEKNLLVEREARKSIEKEKNNPVLPDCLLLMMCEPKLSMEVSKETWVCKTDFVRCLPNRHNSKKPDKMEAVDDHSNNSHKKTKAAAVAAQPPLPPSAQGGRSGIQPGRSSISFPTVGVSVANLIEQKLANAGVDYEPFVLTRCKSAPLRSTVKFVPPELGCNMWGKESGRTLEPHRPATCGVGAAGVGF